MIPEGRADKKRSLKVRLGHWLSDSLTLKTEWSEGGRTTVFGDLVDRPSSTSR